MKGFGKIAIVFLVLVAVLASLGIGYAMWDKTLDINGTVVTGEVNAEFTDAYTDDDGVMNDADHDGTDGVDVGDPDASGKNVPRKDKNVGSSSAEVGADPQTASVTVRNAYPCYFTTAFFGIHNSGSIPVKVQAVLEHCNVDHWVSWDGGATWVRMPASTWYPIMPCTIKLIDFNNDGKADLAIHITQIKIGQQLEPSQTIWMDVDIHVEQGADELATYTFDERVLLVQWNEYEE